MSNIPPTLLFLVLLHFSNSQDQELEDCEAGQFFNSTNRSCQFCESPYNSYTDRQTHYYSHDAAAECKACSEKNVTGYCIANRTYCEAGQRFVKWKNGKKDCVTCPPRKWSEDGLGHCSHCDNDTVCICDTTSPLNFLPPEKNDDLKTDCQIVNGTMICNMSCYTQSRHAITALNVGSISEEVALIDCSCNNRRTQSSCAGRKTFTKQCFENECDGRRYYDRNIDGTIPNETTPTTMQTTLESCYNEYKENLTCSRADCVDLLTAFLPDLQSCNCFHTYNYNNQETATTQLCKGWQDFYLNITKYCTREPAFTLPTAVIVLLILLVLVLLLLLSGYLAVKYGRYLKRKGSLGNIIPYIDWKRVKPLGAAAQAVRNPQRRNADMLHNKEILLKVRFSVLPWRFGEIKPQHVVLKIFSESQVEQHGVELEVINSIQDREMASSCNIISVYGPERDAGNADLVVFLQKLIKKSKTCAALQDVIETNYIGVNGDESPDTTVSRCRYIMMNHCNELSLTKFMMRPEGPEGPEGLTINLVKQLCRDLARALHFLHELNDPHIVHCDVKPDNIFVKRRNNTVTFFLGDFGFAETLPEGRVFTLRGGTPSFYPPEWYLDQNYHARRNEDAQPGQQLQLDETQSTMLYYRAADPTKIDIYAYGMIVWLALHNACEPWIERFSEDWRSRPPRITREVFLRGLFNNPNTFTARPVCVNDNTRTCQDFRVLLTLAQDCWQPDCRLRPAASEVLSRDILREESVDSRRLRYQNVVQHYNNNEVQPAVEV